MSRAAKTRTAVLVAAMGFVACSSATTDSGGTVSQTVGPSGGTVTSSDGTAVVIPPGALSGDVTITIAANPSAPALTQAQAAGTAHVFGPEGQQFLTAIEVTLPVSSLPNGLSESALVAYTAPQGSSAYVALPTSVVDATHVAAQTTHFSNIVVGGPAGSDSGTPALDGGSSGGQYDGGVSSGCSPDCATDSDCAGCASPGEDVCCNTQGHCASFPASAGTPPGLCAAGGEVDAGTPSDAGGSSGGDAMDGSGGITSGCPMTCVTGAECAGCASPGGDSCCSTQGYCVSFPASAGAPPGLCAPNGAADSGPG